MYGSNFWMVTFRPRAWRSLARDADMIPFPSDDATPPVTNTYFVFIFPPWFVIVKERRYSQQGCKNRLFSALPQPKKEIIKKIAKFAPFCTDKFMNLYYTVLIVMAVL